MRTVTFAGRCQSSCGLRFACGGMADGFSCEKRDSSVRESLRTSGAGPPAFLARPAGGVRSDLRGGVPMDFAFWLQLKEVAPYDTRMRLVLHIDLNMMMRMMIGSKIQGAIDQIAEALAKSFNAAPQV